MTVTEHTQNNNDGHFPKEENGAGLQTTKSCHGPLRAMRRAVEPRMHGIGIHALGHYIKPSQSCSFSSYSLNQSELVD